MVLVDGVLTLYAERGGKALLSWSDGSDGPGRLKKATSALAGAVRGGVLGRVAVAKTDGEQALRSDSPLSQALLDAGFIATPRGLRLRQM